MVTSKRNTTGYMTKRQKVIKTVCLVLVWVCLGLYLEITGPTLIDLKIKTGADYEEVAVAVSGRSVGYFIGSAIGGVLVDRWVTHCDLMIGVCLTGGAIATVIVPWTRVVELLWFIIVVQGTFEGVINIAGQKLILLLWEKDAASPLHILHGGFGIGSFIIPLIANPFLAVPKTNSNNDSTISYDVSNQTEAISIFESEATSNPTTSVRTNFLTQSTKTFSVPHQIVSDNTSFGDILEPPIEYLRESRIEYAYLISAVLTLALSVVFYVYQFRSTSRKRERTCKTNGPNTKKPTKPKCCEGFKRMINPATCANGNMLYGIEIFAALFIYYVNIVGGERILGKFIRAYSIEQLGFSVDDGSFINTAFWISFAVGRISGFIAARYIPIRKLILIETIGVLVCTVLLNIFAVNNSLALWILVQPLGFFHAPCFPSAMGWGDYHVEMTGMAITLLLLGGSVGGVVYLKITGYLFEKHGPRAFLYHLLAYGIACFVLAIILDLIGSQHGGRFREDEADAQETDQENELQMLHSDTEDHEKWIVKKDRSSQLGFIELE